MDFTPYLDDLEARNFTRNRSSVSRLTGRTSRGAISPARYSDRGREPNPPRIKWQPVCVNDAFRDPELMIYSQLKGVSDTLASGSGLLLSVRANYGTGIIPSMFGAEILSLPDSADMLRGAQPLPDDKH